MLLRDIKRICLAIQKLMGKHSERMKYETTALSYSIVAAKVSATLSLRFDFVYISKETANTTFSSHGPPFIS